MAKAFLEGTAESLRRFLVRHRVPRRDVLAVAPQRIVVEKVAFSRAIRDCRASSISGRRGELEAIPVDFG